MGAQQKNTLVRIIKRRSVLIALFSVSLSLFLNTGCQKKAAENPELSESRDHLRSGLKALDAGNEKLAEAELKESLSIDPLNNKARLALASLYSSQGGITIHVWLDSFWDAGRDLDRRLNGFSVPTQLLTDLQADMQEIRSDDPKSDEQKKAKAVQNSITELSQAIVQNLAIAAVTMHVFKSIPVLDDKQLRKLDKAIAVLRNNGTLPAAEMSEDTRVYLSLISFIRLVNYTERLIGDPNLFKLSLNQERVCSFDSKRLKRNLGQIQRSLHHLEVGLTINPTDPKTSERTTRESFQQVITKLLESGLWDKLDQVFDPSSIWGQAAEKLGSFVCKGVKTTILPASDPSPTIEEHN